MPINTDLCHSRAKSHLKMPTKADSCQILGKIRHGTSGAALQAGPDERCSTTGNAAEKHSYVKSFCSDMRDPLPDPARKWLPLAIRAVGRFHVAEDGIALMDETHRRIHEGAGNGQSIKRRARKFAVNCGKHAREHAGESWAEDEKSATREVPRVCDEKHPHLRQTFLVLQPCYEWQDKPWDDREACDKALCDWIMKASGIPVPENAAFASTADDRRQLLVAGIVEHVNSARAEPASDKVKELKKRGRGFGGFSETRKRLLIAFDKPGAVGLPTARARHLAQIEVRKTTARERAAAKRRRGSGSAADRRLAEVEAYRAPRRAGSCTLALSSVVEVRIIGCF